MLSPHVIINLLLRLLIQLGSLLLHIDKVLSLGGLLTRIRHNFLLETPVLDRLDNVDGKLSVLAECLIPVRWNTLFNDHHAGDSVHKHVSHWASVFGVCVNVLHATQTGVAVAVLVPFPNHLQDVGDEAGDLKLLGHQVQVEADA